MGKDAGKIAGIAALGATGLGLAGIGPMAGMLGGATAAGASSGLLPAAAGMTGAASSMSAIPGLSLAPEAISAASGFPVMGAGAAPAAAAAAKPAASLFSAANPMQLGMAGANMMNQGRGPQQGMPQPPVLPPQAQGQPQQPFAGMSPYQLPGGLKLHSMNTAGLFRGPYG